MKNQIIFCLSLIIFLSSCKQNRYYSIDDFEDLTKSHKTIAVLPFEVVTIGEDDPSITPEMVEKINATESKAFQVSFHNQLLRSTKKGKNQLRINLQHYSTTISKLEKNNISIVDSWNESSEKMAEILGVDAVVKGRVQKEKYFSDLLSAGIEIGNDIINLLGSRNRVPFVSNRNKNIKSDYSIVDSEKGTVLWSINYTCQADWRQQSDQIVDNINRRSTKHFPYRVD